MTANTTFPALLEAFFTDRLLQQKQVSSHTIASYRDTFCLLLRYAQQRLHKTPEKLTLTELNAPLIIGFLDHLQQERGTSARSRNVRLAAIHSFFQYAALQAPNHGGLIKQVLVIPSIRYERNPIEFLTHTETRRCWPRLIKILGSDDGIVHSVISTTNWATRVRVDWLTLASYRFRYRCPCALSG